MSTPDNAAPTSVGESNFRFLSEHEPLFFQLGSAAERLFVFDPNASLLKLRQLGEAMARSIAVRLSIPFDDRTSQSDLLYAIHRQINLDTTDVQTIIEMPTASESDLPGATAYSRFIEQVRESKLLGEAELDALLRANNASFLVLTSPDEEE